MAKGLSAKLVSLAIAAVLLSSTALALFPQDTAALSGSQFNPERIMDDSVFFRGGDLTASQIQSFLNSKVPVCDTNHARTGSANDSGPPYTCLKDFRQNMQAKGAEAGLCNAMGAKSNQTAAQIIYDVSKACGVSTRVLLVLLQKEQSLITDTWPWDIQYRAATGYGCPDTAPCDSDYYGFFNQVYMAARVYKYYKKVNGPNYRTGYTNYIQYNPNASCGGRNLFIRTQTTAGLYNYTPYQPNAAALNNLYGTGDGCSAYGNRNFWRMYNDWFGSTLTNIAYDAVLEEVGIYTNAGRTSKYTKDIITIEPGEKAYVRVKVRNTGWKNWDRSFTRIGRHGSDVSDFNNTWFLPSRPAQQTETTVVPGAVGTFDFELTGPTQKDSYHEKFQLVLEGKTWLNAKFDYRINVTDPSSASATDNRLNGGEEITAGETLLSPDKHNTIALQKDSNLVLYSAFKPKWYTGTVGKNARRLTMQTDGNLVLYDQNGRALWNTKTYGNPGAYFVMQDDGNNVVYSSTNTALWNSKTRENPGLLNYVSPTLFDRQFLHVGQELETPDRKFKLILQDDGNLVLYSNETDTALWHAKTYNKPSNRLVMQHDGNLVLYDVNGKALWNTRTANKGYSRLTMQQDGNLVVYDKNSKPTWNSRTRVK
jgi:hypothetical protein